ncbi:MAG: ATP-binding protein, partial [Bacteroidota bacterium]
GESFFEVDTPVDYMLILLTGSYRFFFPQSNGEERDMGIIEGPLITGLLPFSRMTKAKARAVALAPIQLLQLHKSHFTEMVNVSYQMVQNLVAAMSNRIRDFEHNRVQTEKLMSLGKLSAGLAHELNNPASAIVRSVEELYSRLHSSPEDFKEVITMKITPDETDTINGIIFPKIQSLGNFEDLTLLEQEARKDDLIDWLEDHDVDQAEDLADTFVEFDLTEDDLDEIADVLNEEALQPVLNWVARVFAMEKITSEIKEASTRIADLVSSIKSYTHMDKSSSIEAVDIHLGIKSTIMMLKHKIKSKQIRVDKILEKDLPLVEVFPGELNQVWTNIIDNAIDAMPAKEGELKIKTQLYHDQVQVEITDNGHGIPQDMIDKIFDPFFTTKGVGEGTGLGLEVTRRIIDRHRGKITVESQPGQTTFSICLPIHHS